MDSGELAVGSGGSIPVERCQVCGHQHLQPVVFLGFMPPVNQMGEIGAVLRQQPSFPAQLLHCPKCELVQLGLIVDPMILFPPGYPYRSGTTRILHQNFEDLAAEAREILALKPGDRIVDIGSNDGTLLSKFQALGMKVLGVDPTDVGAIARASGIDTVQAYFRPEVARSMLAEYGPAKVVTAANVFAHIEDVHKIVEGISILLDRDGVFISESHYLISLLETLQYDTIYHEHLRYYSLASLRHLLNMHGLEVFHAKRIPTHGGSIRVYAAPAGSRSVTPEVARLMADEPVGQTLTRRLAEFRNSVSLSKLRLHKLICDIRERNQKIYGIGAPSRASTLINHVGIDETMVEAILEVKGSLKTGKYLPGTLIPVVDEEILFREQPDYAILFSWHIADELMTILRRKGFKGAFIVPLPDPHVVR